MTELLIIADDFTGALDTGVQFAMAGARTKVITDIHFDFTQDLGDTRVLVIDTESRHIPSQQACDLVRQIAQAAMAAGIPHLFKKTDSALRGNVGAELDGLLEASDQNMLPFIPAFPEMNRLTRGGNHYIDGQLLEESVFSRDPYEPTTMSYIPDIIHSQSDVRVETDGQEHLQGDMRAAAQARAGMQDDLQSGSGGNTAAQEHSEGDAQMGTAAQKNGKYIRVYDCESQQQLEDIVHHLAAHGQLKIMAGCAGLAGALTPMFHLDGHHQENIGKTEGFFAVCGSVNPITVHQVDYAQQHGFTRIRLNAHQKLEENYWAKDQGRRELEALTRKCATERCCIVDSNDPPGSTETIDYARSLGNEEELLQTRIPDALATIICEQMIARPDHAFMIMGGDTLMGFFRRFGIGVVEPIAEVAPGTVLSCFEKKGRTYRIISKSGGFGQEDLLIRLAQKLVKKEEQDT